MKSFKIIPLFLISILCFNIALTSVSAMSTTIAADSVFSNIAKQASSLSPASSEGISGVQEFSGDLQYAFPFTLPSGRNGFTPDVSLQYASSVKNAHQSEVGMGWDLNTPRIERYSRTGVQDLYTNNKFRISFFKNSGDLVAVSVDVQGKGEYRNEVENGYIIYEFLSDNSWKVTLPNGIIYSFGTVTNARVQNTDGSKIFAWYLTKIEDLYGNAINYDYTKSQGNVYLKKISYGAVANPFEVRFEPFYSGTIDTFSALSTYSRGFAFMEKKDLLDRIDVVDTISGDKTVYEFQYTDLNEENIKYLTQIQKKGIKAGVETLTENPTQFSYAKYNGTRSYSVLLPENALIFKEFQNTGWSSDSYIETKVSTFGDYNGDGWFDIIGNYDNGNAIIKQAYINNKNGNWMSQSFTDMWIPGTNIFDLNERVYKNNSFLDINGDFQTDSIVTTPQYYGGGVNHYYQGEKDLNMRFHNGTLASTPGMAYLFEANGDGLVDYTLGTSPAYTVSPNLGKIQKNNGNTWQEETLNIPLSQQDIQNYLNHGSLRFQDFNGDGLDDILILENSLQYPPLGTNCNASPTVTKIQIALLNSGNYEFVNISSQMIFPDVDNFYFYKWTSEHGECDGDIIAAHGENGDVQFLDINRDGLVDIDFYEFHGDYYGNNKYDHIYYNTGSGWESGNIGNYYYVAGYKTIGREMMDINYDGIIDQLHYKIQTNGYPVNGIEFSSFKLQDSPVLTKIQTPTGGSFEYEYTPASGYMNSDGTQANPELPMPRLTLSKMVEDDGIGNRNTTNYSYSGGKLYRPNEVKGVQKQEFLGFQKVVKTLPDGAKIETEFFQGDAGNNFATKGLVKTRKIKNSAGTTLQEERNEYQVSERVTGKVFEPLLTKNVSIQYSEVSPSIADTVASSYDYDSYGNVVEEINYGLVNLSSGTTFTDTGTDKQTRTISYALNAPKHLLSYPKRELRTNYSGATASEMKKYYDGLAFGNIDKGSVTKTEALVSGTTNYISTLTEYNSVGLPTKVTNPRGYDTTTIYDSYNLYPQAVTNAKNQVSSFAYNYLLGAVTSVTDPNGAKTLTEYDPLGRVKNVKVTDPANTATETVTTTFTYETSAVPHSKTQTQYAGYDSIEITTKSYLDGFNRPIQTRQEVEGTNQYQVTEKRYDSRGNVSKEFLPQIQTGIAYSALASSNPATTFTYDALGRVKTITNSLGTTTTEYRGLEQRIFDANNKRKDYIFDAFGNLPQVKEYLGANSYTTSYSYDANKNLLKITDALGNEKNMIYDFLGRQLQEEGLHTPNDANFGVWQRSYDNNGNLTSQIDPKGQTTEFSYDELDRPLTENFDGQAGVEVTYGYDQGSNSIGRLSSVNTSAVQKSLSYDILGRLLSEQKVIDATTYNTAFSYDILGNLLNMTYPDGMQVSYTYNNAGLLETLAKNGTNLLTNLSYSPTGAISQMNYSNGVTATNTYDGNQMYRLTHRVATNTAGTKLQDLNYTYDPVGNVMQINDVSDTRTAKTQNFIYDDLYRLTNSSVVNAKNGKNFNENYSYDIVGNMLSKSDQGAYSYAGNNNSTSSANNFHPHAVSAVNGVNYTYDDNGNLTSNGVWTHAWDYKNRLSSSTNGTSTVNYTYDEMGKRVKKTNATTGKITRYVNQYYNIEDGNVKKFIYAGDQKIATVTSENRLGDTNSSCMPPSSGDWNVTVSCTFTGFATAKGNVIVNNGVTLTIAEGAVLEIKSSLYKYKILGTGKVVFGNTAKAREEGASNTAIINSGEYTIFHLEDHLGSANIDTDSTGNVVEYLDYYPYGSVRTEVSSEGYKNDYKFTGKEQDEDTKLYYYEARYYNSDIGRFVSVDPWSGDLKNPQTLNKYSYTLNNPVKYIDPTGNNPALAIPLAGQALVFLGRAAVTAASTLIFTEGVKNTELTPPTVNKENVQTTPQAQQNSSPVTTVPNHNDAINNRTSIAPVSGNSNNTAFPGSVAPLTHGCGVNVSCSTDFVVTPNGEVIAVPDGAAGPIPTRAPGIQYVNGSGGKGMSLDTTGVRIMDANKNQGDRVNYMNNSGQTVAPGTGKPISNADPRGHLPIKLQPNGQ